MSDDDLRNCLSDLESGDARHLVALPDGSVDRWYALSGAGGDRLKAADAFADQLAAGGRAFSLEPIDARPGGQAVNAARQIDALGEAATLIGHLEHPVLSGFPFETHSMGTPATVRVVDFGSDELQFSEPGPAEDWGLADLLAVVDWDRIVGADALCCTNWVSIRGLTAVFDRLASSPPAEPLPVVVDPGPIDAVDPMALADLFDALSQADSADTPLAVFLSVNPMELAAATAAAGVPDDDGADDGEDPTAYSSRECTRDRAAALRSAIGLTGVVSHGSDAAVGATRDGIQSREMVSIGEPQRTTGAGDRFSAGLACGLARDWPLETALALGNACAAYFVGTGETADPAAVRSLLERID
ncbi:carbohydrate kinase family protein [Natrinema sp. SYSU A 869]|uniref:PfkB family carbohydrate kinase n=1 Tax=Natrinema sp. SYSU A 869 TaxID=2871694 RepID=UPI001CA40366|nr:carbohydrate kinase family protein [Natrinema sp. SYSU A 869]